MAAPRMSGVGRFFDLNHRAVEGQPVSPILTGGQAPSSQSSVTSMSLGFQLVMYGAILLGVVFSSYLFQYASGDLTGEVEEGLVAGLGSWIVWILAAAIAMLLLPNTYEKLKVSRNSPKLVQFGLFFQQGVFWQVMVVGASNVI